MNDIFRVTRSHLKIYYYEKGTKKKNKAHFCRINRTNERTFPIYSSGRERAAPRSHQKAALVNKE